MPKFKLTIPVTLVATVELEAKTEDHAWETVDEGDIYQTIEGCWGKIGWDDGKAEVIG